jgi:hypothetical protein
LARIRASGTGNQVTGRGRTKAKRTDTPYSFLEKNQVKIGKNQVKNMGNIPH